MQRIGSRCEAARRDGTGIGRQFQIAWAIAGIVLAPAASSAANLTKPFTSATDGDLTNPANWEGNALPTSGHDAVLTLSSSTILSLDAATLTVGSFNNANGGKATTLTNNAASSVASTLTLGGPGSSGNGYAGTTSTDLLFVSSATNPTSLTLNGGSSGALNVVLAQNGSFNVGTNATLNLGTAGTPSTLNNGGRTLTVAGSGSTNIGSAVTGTGNLVKSGTGTLTLAGANNFFAGTSIQGGTIAVGSNTALGAGTITFDATGTLRNADMTARTLANAVVLAGTSGESGVTAHFGSATEATGALTFLNTATIALVGTRNVAVHNSTTFTGGFGGSGKIAKTGQGTLVLNGPSSFTGGIDIALNGGNVRLGHSTAAGASTGTIKVNGANAENGTLHLANGITVANQINLAFGRNDPFDSSVDPGQAHVQNVSGENRMTGSFIMSTDMKGVLFRSDAGKLTLPRMPVGNTSGSSTRHYYLFGNGDGEITGVIANGDADTRKSKVVVDGPGTWALSGANTYSGQSTVRGGTLRADAPRSLSGTTLVSSGTGTGLATVEDGGTLAGVGGTAGVTIKDGATITAGTGATASDTAGTLTTGSQTWNGGGEYVFKIAATPAARTTSGTTASWDKLMMGGLTVANSAVGMNPFVIRVVGINPNMAFLQGAKFDFAQVAAGATSMTSGVLAGLFELDTSALGIDESHFSFAASNFSGSSGPTTFFLSYDRTDTQSAPEAGTMALFGLAGSALLARRRRKKAVVM